MTYKHLLMATVIFLLMQNGFGWAGPDSEANILFKNGKFGESRQAFLALAAQGGEPALALKCRVRAAQCLLELGDYDGAKRECTDILNRYSLSTDKAALQQARHLLAELPCRQKHWAEAVESLGQYIRQNQDDPQLAYSVASRTLALEALGRHDEARRGLLEFVEKHPNCPEAAEFKFRAARVLYWRKDYSTLQQELEAIVGHAGDAKDKATLQKVRGLLAQIPYQRRQWGEAAEGLGRFIAENPDAPALAEAVRMRGAALAKLKRWDEARAGLLDFASRHGETPDARDARYRAALCLFDKGDYAAFASEAGPLTALEPETLNPNAGLLRMRLAQVPGKQGHWLEMAEAMERLIPDKSLGDNLDWVQIHCGEGYIKAAEEVKSAGGDRAKGWLLQEKGRRVLAKARERLEAQRTSAKDQESGDRARLRILDTYKMEYDYAAMAREAFRMSEECRAPSLAWGTVTTWLGIARCQQPQPDYDGAIEAFDAVLAAGVVDENLEDHAPSVAAYWRAYIAYLRHDAPAMQAALEKLRTMPDGPIKTWGLRRFSRPIPGKIIVDQKQLPY